MGISSKALLGGEEKGGEGKGRTNKSLFETGENRTDLNGSYFYVFLSKSFLGIAEFHCTNKGYAKKTYKEPIIHFQILGNKIVYLSP